ncbi:MAG: bifunctional phosphoribosylaminoimidazolecarboxamide formyltransferase/IMP cyclohydrolase [Nitriliruptorales bacterium]|nr:bifunctional phosphoribosylaminoimidazolecarboxamide formyltransferase/IMP cyclohydrolase [Nitriliruptorales bacterium]
MAGGVTPVRRALISVYDKKGLADLARGLVQAGALLVSTGSTAAVIRDAGPEVTEVSEVTGFPEMMEGRVKTLHPAIHAGILADRGKDTHLAALVEHGIGPIDLVVVNLYPFRETVTPHPDGSVAGPAEAVEMIDIGGPTMVRAAAKNHANVAVLVDPGDYAPLLEEVRTHHGVTAATRERLAARAFAHTAAYDADIAAWFSRGEPFPERFGPVHRKALDLRYGENPHQAAAWYAERGQSWGLGSARQHQGKPLSYNNLLDADAAWGMVSDLDEPCVAIVKHSNPAGMAVAATLAEAYSPALAGDPVSAFGGIVAVNRPLDAATARQIIEVFTEVVVAPGFEAEALEVLGAKANLRVLEIARPRPPLRPRTLRSVSGGLLVADADTAPEAPDEWTVPTAAKPDESTLAELRFAWIVAKHVKSNAIVLTRDRAAVGVGAGQMSRVDSVRLAVSKSGGRCRRAVLASDAFFPFRDGPDIALEAGVAAIIQPGGSVRDAEVVAACDERGVPMVFTGRRHFRH